MIDSNFYPAMLMSLAPQVLIFALWVTATAAAGRRARAHLLWLVTMTVGRAFGLLSSLTNFAYLTSIYRVGRHSPQASLLLVGQEVLGGLGTLCAVAGGILLLLRFLAPQEPRRP